MNCCFLATVLTDLQQLWCTRCTQDPAIHTSSLGERDPIEPHPTPILKSYQQVISAGEWRTILWESLVGCLCSSGCPQIMHVWAALIVT